MIKMYVTKIIVWFIDSQRSITHMGAEEIGAGGEGIGSPKDSSKGALRSKNALEKFNLLNIF